MNMRQYITQGLVALLLLAAIAFGAVQADRAAKRLCEAGKSVVSADYFQRVAGRTEECK